MNDHNSPQIDLEPRSGIDSPERAARGELLDIALAVFVFIALPVGLLFAVYYPSYAEAQVRSKVAHAKAEMRTLSVGLESFYRDTGAYPKTLAQLTTSGPPYVSFIPPDRFSAEDVEYEYHSDLEQWWALRSLGPSRTADANIASLVSQASATGRWPNSYYAWEYDPTNGTKSSGDIFRTGP